MAILRHIFASILVCVATPGCAGPSVRFAPFNSVDAPQPQVTDVAIEIRPGDKTYLTKGAPKVLGWISSKGDLGDEAIGTAACVEAAKRGGTHILLRSSKKEFDVNDVPLGPIGTQQIDESERATYVVLRVEPEKWSTLPDVLQPKPATKKDGK
ncbi:MAG: hypothetical protein IPK82_13140 [Polyangiaceae bacterium]|nr:hypothetical protein [Polyangiaceae bacterium]